MKEQMKLKDKSILNVQKNHKTTDDFKTKIPFSPCPFMKECDD